MKRRFSGRGSVTDFNVAAVNARLRVLEARIEQLEKALAATKGT